MSTETHINTYIEEVETAYKDAVAGLQNFYEKVEALKARYAQHVADVAAAVGQSVPEIEALVPKITPELDKVEEDASKVEQGAEEQEDPSTNGQPSAAAKDSSKAKS